MEEENSQQVSTNQPEETDYKQKADEYLNNWKRERADFLNYKKEEAKRIEEFVKYANEDVILEVIEAVDDLEQAAKEIKNPGLDQVIKKFEQVFKKNKVERIPVAGEQFNPELHEAVETARPRQAEGEAGEKEGTKLAEVRAGYTLYGKVIRPARIKIIK